MANVEKNSLQIPVPEFVSQSIETGRARIRELEEQAQHVLKDLYARGNDEVESLRERLALEEIKGRLPVEDVVRQAREFESRTRDRAGEIASDLERRLHELHERTLLAMGMPTRDEMRRLGKELEKLGRKVDRLTRSLDAKAAADKQPAKAAAKKPAAKKAAAKKPASRKKSTTARAR